MVDRIHSRKNDGASRSKSQSHQSLPGDFQIGLGVRCDLHNAALARKRRGYVHIARNIKGQALRSPQTSVERAHSAVRVDLVYTVEARCGGSSDEQISLRAKSQVIGRNAGLQ